MQPDKNKEVFIETSIMTDYLIKDRATKTKVDKILSAFDKNITSNYVRMEFKKGPLQYLVYLHNKTITCKSMSEVHQAISKLSYGYQRHRLSTVLEQIESFYKRYYQTKPSEIIKEYGDLSLDDFLREKAISYFGNLIRNSWRNFEKVVDELINETECFTDIQAPYKKGTNKVYRNTPTTCKSSSTKCRLKDFFNENHYTFGDMLKKLQEIDSPDQETINRIKSLKEILRLIKFRNREIQVKDCWYCSDAIIAVEAPPKASIFHNNKQHYEPICEAIEKKSISYN